MTSIMLIIGLYIPCLIWAIHEAVYEHRALKKAWTEKIIEQLEAEEHIPNSVWGHHE